MREDKELKDLLNRLSTTLINYRKKHLLEKDDLARKLGETKEEIDKMESGEYYFTVYQLHKISKRLRLNLKIELEETTDLTDYDSKKLREQIEKKRKEFQLYKDFVEFQEFQERKKQGEKKME